MQVFMITVGISIYHLLWFRLASFNLSYRLIYTLTNLIVYIFIIKQASGGDNLCAGFTLRINALMDLGLHLINQQSFYAVILGNRPLMLEPG